MTGLYLKETVKLFDIVDLTICCSLYKICNGNQFEHMKGTDFVDFMNLKEVSRPVVVRHRENSRVCYLLYVISKEIMNESLAKEWIQHMLEQCKISPDTTNPIIEMHSIPEQEKPMPNSSRLSKKPSKKQNL